MNAKPTLIHDATGDTYQVVRSLDKKRWFVNLNKWDSERRNYGGWFRFSDRKFETRSAAEAYVAEYVAQREN
jgi:hypothetical protein